MRDRRGSNRRPLGGLGGVAAVSAGSGGPARGIRATRVRTTRRCGTAGVRTLGVRTLGVRSTGVQSTGCCGPARVRTPGWPRPTGRRSPSGDGRPSGVHTAGLRTATGRGTTTAIGAMAGRHATARRRAGATGQPADRAPDLTGQLSADLRRHERTDKGHDHQDRAEVLHRGLATVTTGPDHPRENERPLRGALFRAEPEPGAGPPQEQKDDDGDRYHQLEDTLDAAVPTQGGQRTEDEPDVYGKESAADPDATSP